jgi:hypothetical protein
VKAIHVKMFGFDVPAKQTVHFAAERSENRMETYQITQVALGESASKSVVYFNDGSDEWVVGTLTPNGCEQFATDYMSRQPIKVRHTGSGSVYISGFKTITVMDDYDDDSDEGAPDRHRRIRSGLG